LRILKEVLISKDQKNSCQKEAGIIFHDGILIAYFSLSVDDGDWRGLILLELVIIDGIRYDHVHVG
jgi:hypothetical protein